jgi:hypothetical protein
VETGGRLWKDGTIGYPAVFTATLALLEPSSQTGEVRPLCLCVYAGVSYGGAPTAVITPVAS